MSQLFNNEQKLNDIIFANRNQAYGAYALRSAYGNTIFKSLAIMLLGVGFVFSTAFYFSNKNNPSPDNSEFLLVRDTVYVVEFNNKKEVEKVEPKKVEKVKQEENAADNKAVTVVDSTIEVTKTTTTEIVGTPNTSTLTGEIAIAPKDETKGVVGGSRPDTNSVSELYSVDSAPEFEGGLKALNQFLARHLKYPSRASEEGVGGTVFVRFVVDEKGKVGRLTLLNAVGYGMDEEALRVVSLIPKFKEPGKVGGEPVKTYFQVPIRYRYHQ